MKREELIRQIREVGESLIKNADKITPNIEYNDGCHILIDFNKDAYPTIAITYDYVPEAFMRRRGK